MKLDVTDSTAKPTVRDPACLKPTVGPWEMESEETAAGKKSLVINICDSE